jgi:hypothetical protein
VKVCDVQPAFQQKCGHFVAWFLVTFVMSKQLLREMLMFYHRIYAEILATLSEEKNSKKSHKTVPLNDVWTTTSLGRAMLLSLSSHTAL